MKKTVPPRLQRTLEYLPLHMLLPIPTKPVLRRIEIDVMKRTVSLMLLFMGLRNVVKEHSSMKNLSMI